MPEGYEINLEDNQKTILKRLWIYQSERFPLFKHGLLILTFTFSAVAFSRICRGAEGFIPLDMFLIGFYTSLTFFLLLRIFDEFKDAKEDSAYRSYRAVPRGLVSLKELSVFGSIIIISQFFLNIVFMPSMLIAYAFVMAYMLIITKEFYVSEWIKKHTLIYMSSHMLIMAFIDFYTTGLDWLNFATYPPKALIIFLLVTFFNGIIIELGRKIRNPQAEENGVETYSSLYGYQKATVGWLIMVIMTFLTALTASFLTGHLIISLPIFIVFFLICATSATLFLKQPTEKHSHNIEIASGLWTIGMYLTLGAIPLIMDYIFKEVQMLIYYPDLNIEISENIIGGKAYNLNKLQKAGYNVPNWFVITTEAFGNENNKITKRLENEIFKALKQFNFDKKFLAVRSSAIGEDSSSFSFAGQFDSFLYVNADSILTAIQQVKNSLNKESLQFYLKQNNIELKNTDIAVIVQEMIPSDISGVAFGIDPVTGNREAVVISSVYGLGEGLVSGELNSDNYTVYGSNIESEINLKTKQIVFDKDKGFGTIAVDLDSDDQNNSVLSKHQILDIAEVVLKLNQLYNKPQDVEWTISNNKLYILQTRPITILEKTPDRTKTKRIWDNSNIVESYSDVTTPLTFSFIKDIYTEVYVQFCKIFGVEQKIIEANKNIFEMLGFIEGRVYYNLFNWYKILSLLPGYSINAQFMEEMMGVKEKIKIPPTVIKSNKNKYLRLIKLAFSQLEKFLTLDMRIKNFYQLINKTLEPYENTELKEKNAEDLMNIYFDLERKLLKNWQAPISNDFYAMIFYGMLKKLLKKWDLDQNGTLQNDLLIGEGDIISTEPIKKLNSISKYIVSNEEVKAFFTEKTSKEILLEMETFPVLSDKINNYIIKFGNRCIGELKLETITYKQQPEVLIDLLKSYINYSKETAQHSQKPHTENIIKEKLKSDPLKTEIFNFVLDRTKKLVRNRENLRFERTRLFGIIRELFLSIGYHFSYNTIIDSPRDIFYLTKEGIFSYINGTSCYPELQKLIDMRKEKFEKYNVSQPSDRFVTYGLVYHGNNFVNLKSSLSYSGDISGIGCCPGIVKENIKIINNPSHSSDLEGHIMVAEKTDPGWVPLFPISKGILIERGSILSHSAIVARELGIPAIVGINNLLNSVIDGELVEMNGSTGFVKLFREVANE